MSRTDSIGTPIHSALSPAPWQIAV